MKRIFDKTTLLTILVWTVMILLVFTTKVKAQETFKERTIEWIKQDPVGAGIYITAGVTLVVIVVDHITPDKNSCSPTWRDKRRSKRRSKRN